MKNLFYVNLIISVFVIFTLPLSAQNHDYTVDDGITLIQTSRYDSAIIILDKIIDKDSINILALFWKAYALDAVNHNEEAINCYNKILSINPNYLPAIVYKCSVEYEMATDKFSKNCFKKAISRKPVDYLDYLSHGLAYFYLKDYKNTLNDYNKAIELRPDFAYSYLLKSNTFRE